MAACQFAYGNTCRVIMKDAAISLCQFLPGGSGSAPGTFIFGFSGYVKENAVGIFLDCLCLVISIEVSDEAIIKSMGGRRLCADCGASYHTVYMPTKVEGVCDVCGGKLIMREDDKPETVISRLGVYHKQTEPLKDYYQASGKLVLVNGMDSIENITAEIEKKLEAVRG